MNTFSDEKKQESWINFDFKKNLIYVNDVIDTLPINFYWMDKEGNMLACNLRQATAFGFKTVEELRGKNIYDVGKILGWHESFAEKIQENNLKLLKTGQKLEIEETVSLNGKNKIFLSFKHPVIDPNSKVSSIFGFAIDITDRKRMEEELVIAKNQAVQSEKRKDELFAMLTHELRTPLMGLLAAIGKLSAEPKKSVLSEHAYVLKNMQSSGELLLSLINDILDFAKLNNSKFQLLREAIDLQQIIEETLGAHAFLAKNKALELSVDYPPSLPTLFFSDAKRIKQLLVNLLGNAIKFTEKGYVAVKVDCLKQDVDKAWMKISVKDTGIGIPEDKKSKIFEEFEQIISFSEQSRPAGTGLGLAIFQKIVLAFGGEFGLETELHQGSTFWFTLPMLLRQIKTLENSAETTNILPASLKILISHDHPELREILSRQITGIQVQTCTSDEVMDKLQQAHKNKVPFHIVIIDDNMPVLTPEKLIKKILAKKTLQKAKYVLMTKPINQLQKMDLLQMGFNGYLVKPVQPSELFDCVKSFYIQHFRKAFLLKKRETRQIQRPRILLVEDSELMRFVTTDFLLQLSCKTKVAETGKQALDLVNKYDFDMVILDIHLSDMKGYEIAQEIRRKYSYSELLQPVIIAMTACISDNLKARCLAAGMDDVVDKKITVEQLDQLLDKWL